MIEAQKLRTITPDQIKGILESHTWIWTIPYTPGLRCGFLTYATGYGFIKADEAGCEVEVPKCIRSKSPVESALLRTIRIRPATVRSSIPILFPVEADWLVVGTSQHGQFTVQPGDTTFSTTALYYRNVPLPNIAVIDWQDNFGFSRVDVAYGSVSGRLRQG